MAIPRRFLPSIQILRAFEACARLSSFTAAAKELNLTQSAVSRQIGALEEQLGGDLFVRDKHAVSLTVAGESYAHEVRGVLQQLANATLGFCANPQGGSLRLAILPTFGTRWLAPRLPAFFDANPGISINLVTRLSQFDFRLEKMDAAIHYGPPEWPGAELDFLMPETIVPACSRAFKERHDIRSAEDLLAAPLLHLVSRPDTWQRWFAANGVHASSVHGMLIDQFSVATQAAISGLGAALLPTFLIQNELQRGDLVLALDAPLTSHESYYLAWPANRAGYPPLEAFRAWLLVQTASPLPSADPAPGSQPG